MANTPEQKQCHAPNAKEESEDIRLLLFVQLADVLVCTHVEG